MKKSQAIKLHRLSLILKESYNFMVYFAEILLAEECPQVSHAMTIYRDIDDGHIRFKLARYGRDKDFSKSPHIQELIKKMQTCLDYITLANSSVWGIAYRIKNACDENGIECEIDTIRPDLDNEMYQITFEK